MHVQLTGVGLEEWPLTLKVVDIYDTPILVA